MRLGVTLRVVEANGYVEPRDAISHDWMSWLDRHDIHPVLIPNTLGKIEAFVQAAGIDGLLLTNGNDVVAREPTTDLAPERNATESRLLAWAIARGLPVMGCCRGMQMLNAYFGGTVRRDLASVVAGAGRHAGQPHMVRFTEDFAAYLGVERAQTNSYHRQGMLAQDLASELRIFALSEPDGVVEGLVHRSLPIVGIQWHPERQGSCAAQDEKLFNVFRSGRYWQGEST